MSRVTSGVAGHDAVRTPPRSTGRTTAPGRRQRVRYTLYGSHMSGSTYKVALLLSLARKPFGYVHVGLREGAHKTPQFLAKSRYGQVPCLRDANLYLCQSAAILEHVAETTHRFNGRTSGEIARIREWMYWDFDKLAGPVYRLRARKTGFRLYGDELAAYWTAEAEAALKFLDETLKSTPWLASRRATIADIDIYGVVRYAPEAGLGLVTCRNIARWMKRIEALPGFGRPQDILPKEDRLP